MFDIFDLYQNRSFLLFFWWTNSCSSRGYQNIFYVSAVPPHPSDFSHYGSLQLSLICVCREKRSSCCRCSCREQHTHTHTCLCPTDGRQSAPLSACLDTVQLVSCCISPSSPLSDSASWLRAHSYLIRQLFSCRGRRAERILISFGEPTESPALRRADTMGWF